VSIGEYCFIGAGSTIIPNKQISNKSLVAAGSVVIDYVPQNVMVAGIPAKIKKKDYYAI
jgi:acetyltransferase-like isoleucine patch superfamily enzyme